MHKNFFSDTCDVADQVNFVLVLRDDKGVGQENLFFHIFLFAEEVKHHLEDWFPNI